MKKRKLSQYEKIILASAYNLKNYCRSTQCCDCIFKENNLICVLTRPDNPLNWELHKVGEA